MVVVSMLLAQGYLLKDMVDKPCVYLVDDLAAELDIEHRQRFWSLLVGLETQVFLTTVDVSLLKECFAEAQHPVKMFHVEHGALAKEESP